jgi:hypothetical protein
MGIRLRRSRGVPIQPAGRRYDLNGRPSSRQRICVMTTKTAASPHPSGRELRSRRATTRDREVSATPLRELAATAESDR